MKPWKTLASDGKWTLRQRDAEFMVQAEGKIVMTSRRHGGEDELAQVACARISGPAPKVLVGHLGFGFHLRATLDALPDSAKVLVSEASPRVIEWNRGALAELHGHALEDHRVEVVQADVQATLFKHRGAFDVVLLDLDQGPFATTAHDYEALYSLGGLSSVRASMKPGGRLAVFSGATHPGFNKRLREVGFHASVEKTGDGTHLMFLGDL